MNDPISYNPLPVEQIQAPPPLPIGFIQSTSAWESIPKFIRFTVWLYAILTVAGLAIWPILLIAVLAA